MTVNVGVIGVGMIGQDHIRRLTRILSGARVAAVSDVDSDRARTGAKDLNDVTVHETGQDLISDTCVHDIDIARWLLGTEVAAVRVVKPRRNRYAAEHLTDPLLILLEMADGSVVDVEAMINVGYGYDIRGEIVGERGTVELAEFSPVAVKRAGRYGGAVPADWRERFVRAYDLELQSWIDAVTGGGTTGPSTWDGYAATVVSDAALRALTEGERV